MPRKLRPAKLRRVSGVAVSDSLYSYLLWRDWDAARALASEGESKWALFDGIGPHAHQAAWAAIEPEALAEWTAMYPGTRPQSWWWWGAPELRRIYGRFSIVQGAHRCQDTGLPYGAPADLDDLPMCESQAAYLDRLDLWIPGERARVPVGAFESQPFSLGSDCWATPGW